MAAMWQANLVVKGQKTTHSRLLPICCIRQLSGTKQPHRFTTQMSTFSTEQTLRTNYLFCDSSNRQTAELCQMACYALLFGGELI